jgi:hypothetical protein
MNADKKMRLGWRLLIRWVLDRHHGVVQAVVREAVVAIHACVAQRGVLVRKRSGSSLVITSYRVFSRKSVRYMNAGIRVANFISFS